MNKVVIVNECVLQACRNPDILRIRLANLCKIII